MKQVDFDEKLRQMRVDHQQEVSRLKKMIADMDVELADHCKHLHRMHQEYEEKKQQRALLNKEKDRLDREYSQKCRDFLQAHQGHVSRQLEDVSDWAIVNELAARGYHLSGGGVFHTQSMPKNGCLS